MPAPSTVRDLAIRIAPLPAAVVLVGAASHLAGVGGPAGLALAIVLVLGGLAAAALVSDRFPRRRP
jgi:hypothetical protein